ncbi:MAG: hypothetical protein AVDCRST_MAG66-3684 [uncultured Pseudonocardia sp.]|uniref:Uncharacterized protein n=1 Tax=uncultured Pseudonocardia sp. TaxID=211455 RepID=A0A6J4Q9L0_9PSEU|nr:MAG: hypothetical protein AVDCRST_MAG66-3684 [uncultured Pseudonocardia sp.]
MLLLLVIAAMLATGGVVEPALLVLVAGLLVPGRAARCRGRSELLERDSGPSRPAVER